MNGDLDEAVGLLATPAAGDETATASPSEPLAPARPEDHSRWRLRMAQRIAALLDAARFGVKAAYLFGSTKNATAGPASDIDLLLHVEAQDGRRVTLADLARRLEPRARRDERAAHRLPQRAGCSTSHYVTDEDIARGTSYAAKIGAVTDAARPLTLATRSGQRGGRQDGVAGPQHPVPRLDESLTRGVRRA